MFEARLWKLLRNSEAQPKFTLSYKKYYVYKTSLRMSHRTLSYCLTKPTSHVASTPLQVALKKHR